MRSFYECVFPYARHQASPSVPTRSFCESILFVRLEALRGSERRVVRILGMVRLPLTRPAVFCIFGKILLLEVSHHFYSNPLQYLQPSLVL